MLTSANRKLFALRRLKKFSVRDPELVSIYTGYVCPVLEYAVPVWHSSLTTDQAKRLESTQKRACIIILAQRYSGYPEALCTLGLCTLSERHTQLCLSFARKLLKSNFSDWLPPLREELTGRQTRNSNKLAIPRC
uniref:Alkylated DNA repair protein AlkB homologue 8 N-terminal domain-containing protein n=1 Tax=Anguilla anguilla TaxID=7936 RepID=A0A0E9X8E1_ANGAN